ncbi:thioesterase II family protein [Streptomyces sp. NPDC058646]|uniref:thioesterase II family protein n=1 Tax=Streptomyces sp. NPDC058646 TaxID=3346574 RepID=UPI00364B5AAF
MENKETESRWFRQYAPPPAQEQDQELHGVRLVCFPHAGGAASAYLPLSRTLSPAFEVLAVQYPGRQERRRETPAETLTALADAVARELAAEGGGRPYAFFGHSMGAVIAYETARRLDRLGAPAPVHLFLSGRGAPGPVPRRSDQLHGDAALIAEIRRLGGTGGRVLDEPELLEMVLPALRADYRALASYSWVPGLPLDVPVTVLVGDEDPVVPAADAADWLGHTTAPGEFHTFRGGHFYLDAHTQEVAGLIAATLNGVRV